MTPALFALAVALTPELAVRFEGNHQVADAILSQAVDRGGGSPAIATDEGLQRDGLWVLAAYYDRGYVEAHVTPERVRSENEHTVTAIFHVVEGPVYALGEVSVEGDVRDLVPHFAAPGSVFSRAAIVTAVEQARQGYRDAGDGEIDMSLVTTIDRARHVVDLKLEVRRP
jgi:outer membrane protein assembly factor BamA